ncbi:hypothetical protein Bpfe_019356 [Biomphalaria pfeifferi]|uniref:Uncharacterized protein n=1 Tax=Biomphalaria pfeifferi TaxID=112525 RepID=A0AAD8BAZ1_BIOPF|nr:hypothetical protein Bpfe_019356 [Biomphalaria pfeifferi]
MDSGRRSQEEGVEYEEPGRRSQGEGVGDEEPDGRYLEEADMDPGSKIKNGELKIGSLGKLEPSMRITE